ncbi:MAG: outer membrane lipoprotein carrier protein LolA [Bacilli bacterium]|nr:outer membrane lipoprotein carrier protein LolA [Bacilli bacterium]
MKKILCLILVLLLLTACGKNDVESISKRFSDDVNNSNSYKILAKMKIISDEEEFNYNLDIMHLKDNYYKVILTNISNNHEQVILRNNDGVYVITPSLNKSFKFDSSWPNNSSQAYLLGSLLNDINNDKKVSLKEEKGIYIITSKVNYPNNEELVKEDIYFNNKMNITKVIVYDKENNEKIIVEFDKVDLKANLTENDFKLDDYINNPSANDIDKKCEGSNCDKTTSNILEDIIYPLYLPSDTFLTSSETINTDLGKRVILTFAGKKDFTIIEELATISDEFEVSPVFGDPILLNDTIGVIEDNSIRWTKGNISYYLTSNNLSSFEMATIASSMNEAKSVLGSK